MVLFRDTFLPVSQLCVSFHCTRPQTYKYITDSREGRFQTLHNTDSHLSTACTSPVKTSHQPERWQSVQNSCVWTTPCPWLRGGSDPAPNMASAVPVSLPHPLLLGLRTPFSPRPTTETFKWTACYFLGCKSLFHSCSANKRWISIFTCHRTTVSFAKKNRLSS